MLLYWYKADICYPSGERVEFEFQAPSILTGETALENFGETVGAAWVAIEPVQPETPDGD